MQPNQSAQKMLASIVAQAPEVASVTVTDRTGLPLESSGGAEQHRDAVLASFVRSRVDALTVNGDLRGKGRQFSDAILLHATFRGRDSEYLLIPMGQLTAFAAIRPGQMAESALWSMTSQTQAAA